MLPPPIPILGRKRQFEAEWKLQRFVARQLRLRKKRELTQNQAAIQDISLKDQISLISIDILRFLFEPRNLRFGQGLEQRDCLGRRICQLAQTSHEDLTKSAMESVLLKLTR